MKNKNIAVPAALASMICVQGGASIAKKLFPVLGSAGTSTLRIGLSALLLFVINRPRLSALNKQQWLYCFGYGACIGSMNLIFYYAIQRIPLGLGVTVEFIGPLLLALFLSRKLLDLLWALFACAGILLIVPWQSNNIDIIGLGLAFLAGAFWAGYIVMGGKISQVVDNRVAVTVGMGIAAILILPFGMLSGSLAQLSFHYLLLGFGVAIFSSALPFTLDMIALKRLPPKTFSILTSLQPAFGALSGLLFLKEYLSFLQWMSILCVVIASMGTTLTNRYNDTL
ncbi:DMT family transporter [Sphingobacterium spiritivorum]|uniref:Membrane protein n=1 Tax=Sphingobacterium spiritivorum ATCC 33861 TaxID=525373 RepID=D7VS59_SPHSI|nr:DMT family transporter [Sphingobacterium spiritivorum]EFK56610.1 putative membrane protein [Sphingobacterium spiritivorum ATCC 33861]QQT35341.1 DMT family transporter [Sphingobacterium spiritivorum]WQD32023.1 DMT family transporter [Sphingobacterium spiritivorum]SUJ04972.1 Inner membrane transporter rhtA [Sphingobacterium spiritivorum]